MLERVISVTSGTRQNREWSKTESSGLQLYNISQRDSRTLQIHCRTREAKFAKVFTSCPMIHRCLYRRFVTILTPHLQPYQAKTTRTKAPTIPTPINSKWSFALAHALHHLPAKPPPSSASALSRHLLQLSPIKPMIITIEILDER